VANVWLIAALWIGLALAASVLSVWLTVSVALTAGTPIISIA
jgi:hypothetical protein